SDVRAFQAEIVKGHIPKEALESVSIRIVRHTIVTREKIIRADPLIKLSVIQTLVSIAVVKRARQQQLQPILVFISIRHPPLVSVKSPSLAGHFATFPRHVAASARDHVDHSKESIVPVKTRSRPANDLNSFNQIHIENEFRPNGCRV